MNTKSMNIISNQCRYNDVSVIRFIALNIAVLFIGLTVIQLFAAYDFRDYESAPAYIDNVSSEYRHTRKGVRTEYTFDVHWFYDGEEHVSTRTSSIDAPDYDLSEVRINPDTKEMTLGSTQGSLDGALLTIATSAISFVIWLVLFLLSKNRKKEMNDNCNISIGIGIVGLPIALLCTFAVLSDSTHLSSAVPVILLDICFAISLIAGIIVKKKLKKS